MFSIAICRQSGDNSQSKNLFLSIFDQCFVESINVFDCRLFGVGKVLLNHPLAVMIDAFDPFMSSELCYFVLTGSEFANLGVSGPFFFY